VLDDDGFVLTESSAILKYLAEKTGSELYPSELQARARVNEVMDWFNTGFYRELAYHVVYPQVFPHHKRPDDAVQQGTLDWGVKQSGFFLDVLDRHILGDRPFVAGDDKTIADHFGAALLSSARLIGQPFDAYPNVARWFAAMRALPCWAEVNQVFDGFVGSLSERRFVCV
ncbi:MAG: glutathione S-transferase family protein, partial [Myxococcales bacterium]|nr:glutathione S-transferase family protein [Myxococcales bacterium]